MGVNSGRTRAAAASAVAIPAAPMRRTAKTRAWTRGDAQCGRGRCARGAVTKQRRSGERSEVGGISVSAIQPAGTPEISADGVEARVEVRRCGGAEVRTDESREAR